MSNFSSRLREIRFSKKITQENLGKALGCSPIIISLWETGRSEPNTDMLLRLAGCLGVSVDQLLGENNVATEILKAEL